MWLSDVQSELSPIWRSARAEPPISLIISPKLHTGIGVGLTAFGVLFMALGVILLFDSGFIAVGNVGRLLCWIPRRLTYSRSFF